MLERKNIFMLTKDVIENRIENIVKNIIEQGKIVNRQSTIHSLELTSFEFIQIIVAIEEEFSIEFAMDDLIEDRFNTIGDIANRVDQLVI